MSKEKTKGELQQDLQDLLSKSDSFEDRVILLLIQILRVLKKGKP